MSDQALFAQTRATDNDGNPISGATASFFASGTYTPITIYSDEAATIPLANPVSADANGAFPQVFTTASARCIVRDADGAVVYTLDPVPFARAAATSASATPFEASEDIPETTVQDAIERVQLNATGAVATLSGSLGSAATKGFLDEDDFASDSATSAPSQQSAKAYIDTAIPAKLNASGSAPIYACRAWVNFNGTGTVAIRAAGNVSSITDNGTGDYTINFTTAMPHANYAIAINCTRARTDRAVWVYHAEPNDPAHITTSSLRIMGGYVSGTSDGNYRDAVDMPQISVAIFC